MPPNAPHLEVQFATTKSIRLLWTQPEDGGALIQGYTLNSKRGTDDWTTTEISPDTTMYTLNNLYCGTTYHIYILAHNRVGNGSPSSLLTVNTKGGPPQLPKEKDLISSNATALLLNLFNWPDGGCPISHFTIFYKPLNQNKWSLISDSVTRDKLIVEDLAPANWYQLKITAYNDAGSLNGLFNFATTTLEGEKILPPPTLMEDEDTNGGIGYKDAYIIVPSVCLTITILCLPAFWYFIIKKKR